MMPGRPAILIAWIACWWWSLNPVVLAQPPIESLRDGFKRLQQGRLTLITDLPIDDELRAWPEVLDQAIAIWTEQWRLENVRVKDWQLTAYLIGDRKRFVESGLVPQIPSFEDGYQLQDTIFLTEQPSVYYRRHLFLHEATHWVMYRSFGGAGSPWFMEGMADLYGTHRWTDRMLTLGIVPRLSAEVPQWGRFKRLQDMLPRDDVPSLRQIVNYANESGNRMDRYVWSWAACVFFANHPEYRDVFFSASEPPLDYSLTLSKKLLDALEDRWPRVVADWNGFLSDFDFGYVPEHSMPRVESVTWTDLGAGASVEYKVNAAIGWQPTGVRVHRGDTLHLSAEGSCQVGVGTNGKAWISQPPGITIRYVKHQPLGRLLATIVPIPAEEGTQVWEPVAIGRDARLPIDKDGLLMLKINDAVGDLGDNEGSLQVVIASAAP
jgi:hypothetical protein